MIEPEHHRSGLLLTGIATKLNFQIPRRSHARTDGLESSAPGNVQKRRKKPRAPRTGGFHRPVYQVSRIGPFEPLGHTQFRHYTIAAFFSFSAFFIHMLVRGWLVNELTGSPLLVSLVPVLFISPMLIFTLIGGELADRFKRTRILAIGETVVFATYVTLAVLALADVVQAWHVLALTGVHGVTAATYAPSRQSLVGDLVRPRLQRAALGLSPAMFNLAQIAGPLVGGIVLATVGAGAAAALGAALLIPAVPIFASLKPVAKSQLGHRGSFLQNMREGVKYIGGHRTLRWYLIAGFVLVITVNTWMALMPPLAKDVLGRGAGGLAALQVSVGIGALLGAVMSVPIAERFGEKRLTIVAGFSFAGLVLALSLSQIFLVSLAIAGVAAAVATLYFVTNMITMQLTAAPEFRSRVISVRFIMFGFGPFGMIILGTIAEFLGTQWALGIAAVSGASLLLLIATTLKSGEPASIAGSKPKSRVASPVTGGTVAGSVPLPSSPVATEAKAEVVPIPEPVPVAEVVPVTEPVPVAEDSSVPERPSAA